MQRDKRYCAFCSSERRLYLKNHAGGVDALVAFVMSALIMWIRWQEYNPKILIIFASILMTVEVLIQIRYRLNLACQFCGFDPILYKKNPEVAAQMVKRHLDRIQGDPDYLLSERAQSTLRRLKRVRRVRPNPEANL